MTNVTEKLKGVAPAKRSRWQWLGYAVALGLLGVIVANADWANMGQILRGANPWWVAAMVVLAHSQFVLSAIIWDRYLRHRDVHVPFIRLVQLYFIGNFFSTMLPSRYSGDFYRAYAVGWMSGRHYTALASVVLERLSGMFVLLLMGFLASMFAGNLLKNASMSYPILMVFGVFMTAAALLFTGHMFYVVRGFLKTIRLNMLIRPMEKFHDAVAEFGDNKAFLFRTNVLAFFIKMFAFVCIYIGAVSLNLSVPFHALMFIMPLIYVLEAIPVSIYGMGIREGGFVFFFTQVGLTLEQAFALSIIVLFGRFCCAFTGGILYLLLNDKLPTPADAVRAVARSGTKPPSPAVSNATAGIS